MRILTQSRTLALQSLVEDYLNRLREISTPLNSSLWKVLVENPLLAGSVRILKIQGDYGGDGQVDEFFENVEAVRNYFAEKNATDLEAERILVSALKEMSGLTSFQWTRTPPLIDRNQEDDIWITLANHCPSLNVIDVVDALKPYEPLLDEPDDPAYQRPTHNPNFYLFKDLKSFSFATSAYNFPTFLRPDIEQCAKMLVERCPNLEILHLEYLLDDPDTEFVSASPLLSGPPLKSLRQLTLRGFELISTELNLFLSSHSTIEILSLLLCKTDQFLVLFPHTLPRLKRLDVDDSGAAAVVNAILESTIPIVPRPLQHIEGHPLNDAFLDSLQHCGICPTFDSLLPSWFHGDGNDLASLLTKLSRIAPNLKWLGMRANNLSIDRTLYHVFGRFPHLNTLKGIQIISSCCEPASENTERIRALVTLCPVLEFIGDQIDPPNTDFTLDVMIKRHGSHRTWALYRTEGEEALVYVDWGARGEGCFDL